MKLPGWTWCSSHGKFSTAARQGHPVQETQTDIRRRKIVEEQTESLDAWLYAQDVAVGEISEEQTEARVRGLMTMTQK